MLGLAFAKSEPDSHISGQSKLMLMYLSEKQSKLLTWSLLSGRAESFWDIGARCSNGVKCCSFHVCFLPINSFLSHLNFSFGII